MSIGVADWTTGTLSTAKIPEQNLKPLTISPSGGMIWKSNNPEEFTSNGWLMQNARSDGSRGGSSFPLTGTSTIYLFHKNGSNSTKFLHLLVTNPQNGNITVNYKGSMYTLDDFLLGAPPPPGGGPSANVAANWTDGNFATPPKTATISSFKAHQIGRATLTPGNMIDGRFELTTTAGAFVYTVVTSSGSKDDAVNASQGGAAAGLIKKPSASTFGREAGVCNHSIWEGTTQL